MTFLEVDTIYIEKDAPKVKQMIKLSSITNLYINTAGDDKDSSGDYYVWVSLESGQEKAIFAGTLHGCQIFYLDIKEKLTKLSKQTSNWLPKDAPVGYNQVPRDET